MKAQADPINRAQPLRLPGPTTEAMPTAQLMQLQHHRCGWSLSGRPSLPLPGRRHQALGQRLLRLKQHL